jgi:hypothetical protein
MGGGLRTVAHGAIASVPVLCHVSILQLWLNTLSFPGQHAVRSADAAAFVGSAAVDALPGVGWAAAQRLRALGAPTCDALRRLPLERLQVTALTSLTPSLSLSPRIPPPSFFPPSLPPASSFFDFGALSVTLIAGGVWAPHRSHVARVCVGYRHAAFQGAPRTPPFSSSLLFPHFSLSLSLSLSIPCALPPLLQENEERKTVSVEVSWGVRFETLDQLGRFVSNLTFEVWRS